MYKILQVAIITILCDQLSKLTMLYLLDLPSVGIIDVFPPYLKFTMAWNYGVNLVCLQTAQRFALGSNHNCFFNLFCCD